jgi:hypothetical protein
MAVEPDGSPVATDRTVTTGRAAADIAVGGTDETYTAELQRGLITTKDRPSRALCLVGVDCVPSATS